MNATNTSQIVYACTSSGQKKFLAAGSCHDDRAAVATMPASWVPRHAGPILANYLKQREQDHQKILEELSIDAAKLNSETDAEVRLLAENLQCLIEKNQTSINCIANNIDTDPFKPLTAVSRDFKLENVNQMINQRVQGIGKFKRDAEALEKKRADRLRTLLSQNFNRLVAVGNDTPKGLLHYFDERVYEANQQLLSNCRAYIELEARLRSQADASVKRARASLNQLCLGIQVSIRRRSSQRSSRKASDYRPSFSASDTELSESLVPSLKTILNEVAEVDKCMELFVEAYKTALHKIFNDFSVKLIDLRGGLGKRNRIEFKSNVFETSELLQDMEKNLRRLASFVNLRKDSKGNNSKRAVLSTYHDALKLQNTLADLTGRLWTTFDILNDAGHLWDAHIMRTALAQKLTMATVEDLLTSNDSIELANDIVFDIYLDQIRAASDRTRLRQCFQDLTYLLDKTANMYYNHSEAEIERLEQYLNLPGALADTLLAEFNCFLELHPREQFEASASNVAEQIPVAYSPQKDSLALTLPLPRLLLQSELQWKALQNWKNGFLESVRSNVSVVPEELKSQARSWVDKKIAMINVRYSMKMMSHGIRLERVTAAREARLAELSVHEDRLASHLQAIYDLIDTLPKEASEFLSIDSPSLYPFCQWIARYQAMFDDMEECDRETTKLKMSSYAPRLMKHRVLFEDSLDEAIEEYKMSFEQRLHAARIANLRFITALKLLGEGGNYSPQEALRTSAVLVKVADSLEASVHKIYECLYQRRSQLLNMADALLATLSGVLKEVRKAPTNGASKNPKKN